MGEYSGIAWTDHSFNPVWGCMEVSPGCANCYAKGLDVKFKGGAHWGEALKRLKFGEAHWNEPRKWNKKARKEGVRRRVFGGSMCDVFEDHPVVMEELAKLWRLIRETPDLDWLLLTKRPHRIMASLPVDWDQGYPNVWLGVSVEDVDRAHRIGQLARVPAVVRFVSYEPALGVLSAPDGIIDLSGIDWIIYGGESGQRRRLDQPWWVTAIYERCRAEGIAFFFKQSAGRRPGEVHGVPDDIARTRQYPTPREVVREDSPTSLF